MDRRCQSHAPLRRKGALLRPPLLAAPAALLLFSSCSAPRSALDPAAPGAEGIERLWWWMFWIGLGVELLVVTLLLAAVFRRRRDGGDSERFGLLPVILGGVALPGLVLPGLFALNLDTFQVLGQRGEDPLVIEVVGNQWWWEVVYPEQGIVTANEVHVPVGRPVQLVLTSDDVIHSFWVPPLAGKRDLIPGTLTTLEFLATDEGMFGGACAEFCGLQHAKMQILVVAEAPEVFAAWAEEMAEPPMLETEVAREGLAAFLANGCGACHTIAGTEAQGELGPPLTHFGRRLTIGAGTVANTPGHLGGWIANPHSIKEGVRMPPIRLAPDELRLLIAFLEDLE